MTKLVACSLVRAVNNMEENVVPKHHVQQEVCSKRPAYREGRNPKAVKVYTVSQESRYILIQGVPAMGATHELIKLCAVYGAIEEYRILDEYPAAEEFTEVYWVKFRRIPSARFAKRKLDNYSFLGGVLHVCYAPEYETVQETREKLQDRRKVIAVKTRNNRAEDKTADPTAGQPAQDMSMSSETSTEAVAGEVNQPPWATTTNNKTTFSCSQSFSSPVPFQGASGTLYAGNDFAAPYPTDLIQTNIESPYFTLQIPPPPQIMYARGVPEQHLKRHFDHARVPSSHATLPHGYDPRMHMPGQQDLPPFHFGSNPPGGRIETQPNPAYMENSSGNGGENVDGKQDDAISGNSTCDSGQKTNSEFRKMLVHQINSKLKKTGESVVKYSGGSVKAPKDLILGKCCDSGSKKTVVVKDFQKSGVGPRFVPRQAEAAIKKVMGSIGETDRLGKQIRQNALRLREEELGPTLKPRGDKGQVEDTAVDVSVTKTTKEIRKKVSQFSSAQMPPQAKKLKPSTEGRKTEL